MWVTWASLLVACSAIGQVLESPELIIPEGDIYTITADNAVIIVDRWIMEDNSILQLAPDVPRLEIRALEATIGANVTIVARGNDGAPGNTGSTPGGSPGLCNTGNAGGRGEAGTPGLDGKTVDIRMGLINANSLFINASGGRGGDGGQGGRGQTGSRGTCQVRPPDFDGCPGSRGGRGGQGGNAGHGGNGGNVTIEYWPIADAVSVNVIPLLEGGISGAPGLPGPGGPGGPRFRCGTWPFRRTQPGGGSGSSGSLGGEGQSGSRGSYTLRAIRPVAATSEGR